MYVQYPFGEQKHWEAKVKVKETDPKWSQVLFFPCNNGLCSKTPNSLKDFSKAFIKAR